MDQLKVLVLDDKRIISDMFSLTLGHIGHTIKSFNDADQALASAAKEDFDIAFLDIVMPKKDGVAVLEELRSISPDLPVVMMSAYTVQEKRNRLKEMGADICLKKPFAMDDVRKVVKSKIGKDI